MGPTALRDITYTKKHFKNIHRQNQIKPCCLWRYIEILQHETISLCKKLNSIYIIFYRDVQLSWECSQQVKSPLFTFTFTFSHLADAFIQSDLQLGST